MAVSSFASGAVISTQGWAWLNVGAILPVALTGMGLWWLALQHRAPPAPSA